MTTPLVRAVAQHFPQTKIDILAIPQTGIVFRENPHVNNVLLFDKRARINKLSAFFKILAEIKAQNYDAAISTTRSITNSLLVKFAGIPNRIGFASQKLLTHPVTHQKGMHMRLRYLALIQPFSQEKFDAQTEMFWTTTEEDKSRNIRNRLKYNGRPVIGIAPGSVWETKRWPKSYYAELLTLLDAAKINVLLLGGPDERELCSEIDPQKVARNFAGELSITGSAAVIEKCDLMIVNDSAPLHIANAVQTDVFAFFGPTVERFGCYPYRENDKIFQVNGLDCRPCGKHGSNKCPQKHFKCMKDIRPQKVFKLILQHFGETHV